MDDESVGRELRATLIARRDAEVPFLSPGDVVGITHRGRARPLSFSVAAAIVSFGALLAALVIVRPSIPGAPGSQATDRPLPPSVIGLSLPDATVRLREAGYTIQRVPGESGASDAGVLRQSPVPDWGDLADGVVRVSVVYHDELGRTLSAPASVVSSAIQFASGRLAAEGHGTGAVVEARPVTDGGDGKGAGDGTQHIVEVHLTGEGGGALVVVSPDAAEPIIEFQWYPGHPWIPASLYTDDELKTSALAAPGIETLVGGHDAQPVILDRGGRLPDDSAGVDPICRLPNGYSTCATIAIYVGSGEAGLVLVNYVTLGVSVVRLPAG
jgi:hypothetical protein